MFFSKSLKTTFNLSIILVVLAIALLNIIPLSIEKKQREQEVAKNMDSILDLQHSFIETWLADRSLVLETLSTLPIVKTIDKENMLDVFQQFVVNSKDFSALVFVNKDGFVELDTGGNVSSNVNLSDREYFVEAKNGNTHISDVIIGRNNGKPLIIIARPIYSYEGSFQGLIFGSVMLSTLEDIMKQLKIGETGRTFLVDKNGIMIQTTNPNQESTDVHQLIHNNLELAKMDQPFEKYYRNTQDTSVMGDYKWVNDKNWLIIGEIRKSEVLSPFYKSTIIMIGISLIVLISAYVFMSKVIYKRIHSPIKYVLNGAKQIISGEYTGYQINKKDIEKSPAELKELCDVYNEMSTTISCQFQGIKESEEKFRSIISTAKDAIIIADENLKIISWNKSAEVIFGYTEEEILGQSIEIIKPKKYLNLFHYRLDRFLQHGETGNLGKTFEVEGLTKTGKIIPIELSLNNWAVNDNMYFCGIIRDITSRKEDEAKIKETNQLLKELSQKDGLTGVANRRHFDNILEMEWNAHIIHQQSLSVILFDIDHFKDFNDTYGHQKGDECLLKISEGVEQILRNRGLFLSRYGGEEFICLLPNTNSNRAVEIAELIRKEVESMQIEHTSSTCSGVVTISVGVSTIIPGNNNSSTELIKNADLALYKGKREGRNQVNSYKN